MGQKQKQSPPERRSTTRIDEASDNRLLQVLSKPRNWVQAGMKPIPLQVTARKRGRSVGPSGFFDTLPQEILDMILLYLDYRSLGRLCQTNTKVETYIKKLPFYKFIIQHCQHVLRALATINLLRVHTAGLLYMALCNPKCSAPKCNSVGNTLLLPNCRRTCIKCIESDPDLVVTWLDIAQKKYALSEKVITNNVTCFLMPKIRDGTFVVEGDVIALAARIHGCVEQEPFPPQGWSERVSVPFPFLVPKKQELQFARQCLACFEAHREYRQIGFEIECPLSPRTQKARRVWERKLEGPAGAVFNREQLLHHIRSGECSEAPSFWSQRNGSATGPL